MGFRFNTGSYKEWADKNAKPFAGYSSVEENFTAGVGQVFDEESTISRVLWNNGEQERNQQIKDLAENGTIDEAVMSMFTEKKLRGGRADKVDYSAIAEYLNENKMLDESIDTDEDLDKVRNDELASLRNYRNQIFDTSLVGGSVARFAGSMVASGLDPVNAAAMLIAAPVAGARAVSRAMYTASAAGRAAALNMAVAVPIEPFIHSWKETIGIGEQYTLEDSLFNIGASGVLGGAVGGIAAAVGKRFTGDSIINKDYPSLVSHFKKYGMDEDDAETMARFVDESNQAYDKNMSAKEFVEKTELTQARMEEGIYKNEAPPKIDSEDTATLDALLEGLEDDAHITLDDGTTVSIKELGAKIDEEVEMLNGKLGCLSGK